MTAREPRKEGPRSCPDEQQKAKETTKLQRLLLRCFRAQALGYQSALAAQTRSATADVALFLDAYVNRARPARADAAAPNTMPELLEADSAMREK